MANKSTKQSWRPRTVGRKTVIATGVETVTSFSREIVATDTVSTGPNLHDWFQRIVDGRDATTSLTGTRYSYRSGIAEWRADSASPTVTENYFVQGDIWKNELSPPTTYDGALAAKALSECQIKFTKKVRSRTQGWAGGVFAGELVTTARMLASPARALHETLPDLVRRAKFLRKDSIRASTKSLRRALARNARDLWLTYSFGVKPLLGDIEDAAVAFDRLATGRSQRDKLVITSSSVASSLISGNPHATYAAHENFPTGFNSTLIRRDSVSARLRGRVLSRNPSGEMPAMVHLGLDISSVLPTGWELVPYSFLIDYFSNLGDVLDAWSIRFIEFAFLVQTLKSVGSRSFENTNCASINKAGTGRFYSVNVIRRPSARLIRVERKSVQPIFSPQVAVKLPGFPSTKWINMAALADSKTNVLSHTNVTTEIRKEWGRARR